MTQAGIGLRLHGGLNRLLVPIENIAAALAGAMTVLAMVLTTLDAFGRYLFNSPMPYQFYFTTNYLLVGLVMLALPYGFRSGGYIRVGMVLQYFPHAVQNLIIRVGLLLSAAYIGYLALRAWAYFWKAYQTNAMVIEDLNWSVAASWVWVPVGCGLLALRLLLVALGPAGDLSISHDPDEEV